MTGSGNEIGGTVGAQKASAAKPSISDLFPPATTLRTFAEVLPENLYSKLKNKCDLSDKQIDWVLFRLANATLRYTERRNRRVIDTDSVNAILDENRELISTFEGLMTVLTRRYGRTDIPGSENLWLLSSNRFEGMEETDPDMDEDDTVCIDGANFVNPSLK